MFKAFDKVIVRTKNTVWQTAHYSYYNKNEKIHYCDNVPWEEVIPHTELTELLIGTRNNYTDPLRRNENSVYIIINSETKQIIEIYDTIEQIKLEYDKYKSNNVIVLRWFVNKNEYQDITKNLKS